tara:strand:- start:505 stop:1194 length:690 start_codon:yes stop_codon:yes gene_type:complete
LNSLHKTAILVFANSAKEELVHKSIPNSEQLFDKLTQSTLRKAKDTGLPTFHISDKDQVGSNFGERFTNAIAAVFDRGFNNIITIGNDTPHLKTQHLKNTAKQLALGKTIIGPSVDGGFYLLGLQKNNFDVSNFKKLPWQRYSLYSQISTWLQSESCELIKLPVLQDVDNEKDLRSLLLFSKTLSTSILLLIIGLLRVKIRLFHKRNNSANLFSNKCFYNKGSPEISFV